MPTYRYSAADAQGKLLKGEATAQDVGALEAFLLRRGEALITAQERRWFFALPPFSLVKKRLTHRALIDVCFHLELLLHAKIPLADGMSDLCETEKEPRFQQLFAHLLESLEGGAPLWQALEAQTGVFPPYVIALFRAGEASGELPLVLKELTIALKWEDELISSTMRLLLYPAFLALTICLVALFLMTNLVPHIKSFVAGMGDALPLQTQALFLLSDFLIGNALALFASFFLFLGSLFFALKTPRIRLAKDRLLLRLPLLGQTFYKIAFSRFLGSFGLLYRAKVPLLDALVMSAKTVGNLALEEKLTGVSQKISEGVALSDAFSEARFFSPLLVRMLKVGEASGELARALSQVHYFYERDIKEATEKMQKLIEPLLTVFLGLLLGWIMLAVLSPIYDLIGRVAI